MNSNMKVPTKKETNGTPRAITCSGRFIAGLLVEYCHLTAFHHLPVT
jgi:hypothetical protein